MEEKDPLPAVPRWHMSYRLNHKIKSINPWHFLWIAALLSEIFAAAANALLSLVMWRHISSDLLVMGAINALFVPLVVAPVIVYFAKKNAELSVADEMILKESAERRLTERNEEMMRQHEQLRALVARMAEAEEAERRRIARELHNQVCSQFTVLGLGLHILRADLSDKMTEPVKCRIDESLLLVSQMTASIRRVMTELRPSVLDDYGLVRAIHWYGKKVTDRWGLPVAVAGDDIQPRLPPPVENALFRIFHEALTNVMKHAKARNMEVEVLSGRNSVALVFSDDGVGFDTSCLDRPNGCGGWGLLYMKERTIALGGQFRVDAAPRQGTRITVEVPR